MNPIVHDTKDIYIGGHQKNNQSEQNEQKANYKPNQETMKNKHIDKIIDSDKPLNHKVVPKNISLLIQQKRCQKKLTQKELARLINEKIDVVQDYENGKAIFNNNVYNKFKKVLQL